MKTWSVCRQWPALLSAVWGKASVSVHTRERRAEREGLGLFLREQREAQSVLALDVKWALQTEKHD